MKTSEGYGKIRGIFADAMLDVDLHSRRGVAFHFPIYMTDTLKDTSIDALELSVRSYNCLKRAGINTIGDLCEKVRSANDLKAVRNCGKTSAGEIMENLFAYQYSLLDSAGQGRYLQKVIEMNVVNGDGSN